MNVRLAAVLLQAQMPCPHGQQEVGGVATLRDACAGTPDPLGVRLDEAQRRRTQGRLVELRLEALALGGVDVDLEERAEDRLDPVGEGMLRLDVPRRPAALHGFYVYHI